MAPESEHPVVPLLSLQGRRGLHRWPTGRHSRPAVVHVGPRRGSDMARRAMDPVGIAPTYTYSVSGPRRPHRRRRSTVATTRVDGRSCPTGKRWSREAGASSGRAAVGGSCTSTSDRRRRRRRPLACHPSDAHPCPIERHRGRLMTSFPAEVRCTRRPCRHGVIYRCPVTGSAPRTGHLQRDRCRMADRSAP